MNTIDFKGISSASIDGLLICELPPISKPPMRIMETTVDGRHGSIIDELGYSSYDKTAIIGLHGNFDINKVIKYFSGEGDIVFSNEPDKVYRGRIVNQIDYTRLLRFRQASVTFRVQPFKHKNHEAMVEAQTATASGTNIVLKDSGATPMRISTDAETILVHGINLVNANAFALGTNTSIDISEGGYCITAKGKVAYSNSKHELPLSLRGKSYCLRCDAMTSAQNVDVIAQVNIIAPSGNLYSGLNLQERFEKIDIPSDATKIEFVISPNNTNVPIAQDNTLTIKGLRLVPYELANYLWHEWEGVQTIPVVDGVAEATGYEPCTIISNVNNLEMSVDYFKAFEVFNEGLEPSRPKLILKGSGTVELKVNGMAVFTYTFPEGENEVVIDSDIEEAYLGAELKNRNMLGDFPELVPKTNKIEWSGALESIEILPRSRWL